MSSVAEILVKREAMTFRTDPMYTYTTGLQSPVYTDNRKLLGFVDDRKQVTHDLAELASKTFSGVKFDAVAGTATAGIPWAAWIANEMSLPMLYVRSSTKEHGKGSAVEGYAPEDAKVLLVEDLFSTGSSAINSVEHLRGSGFKINHCIGIVTYGKPVVAKTFAEHDIEWAVLTQANDVVNAAAKAGQLTPDQITIVEEWLTEQQKDS